MGGSAGPLSDLPITFVNVSGAACNIFLLSSSSAAFAGAGCNIFLLSSSSAALFDSPFFFLVCIKCSISLAAFAAGGFGGFGGVFAANSAAAFTAGGFAGGATGAGTGGAGSGGAAASFDYLGIGRLRNLKLFFYSFRLLSSLSNHSA